MGAAVRANGVCRRWVGRGLLQQQGNSAWACAVARPAPPPLRQAPDCTLTSLPLPAASAFPRPCPLAQQYIGVTVKKPLQRFQLMNEICYSKVGGRWMVGRGAGAKWQESSPHLKLPRCCATSAVTAVAVVAA